MESAVSVHTFPLPTTFPPHHRTVPLPLHLKPRPPHISTSKPKQPVSLSAHPKPLVSSSPAAPTTHRGAATGYAAALADASLNAGTLVPASLHARSLLHAAAEPSSTPNTPTDARVAALVRMLVRKGKAALVLDALEEFVRICGELLPGQRPRCVVLGYEEEQLPSLCYT